MLTAATYLAAKDSDPLNATAEMWVDRLYIITPDGHHDWFYDDMKLLDKTSGMLGNNKYPDACLIVPDKAAFKKIIYRLPKKSHEKLLRFLTPIAIAMGITFFIFYMLPAAAPLALPYISQSHINKLGEFSTKRVTDKYPVCKNPAAQAQLDKLIFVLTSDIRTTIKFRAIVVDSNISDVTSSVNGDIIIYRKFLDEVKTEAELDAAIAHDVKHVKDRDSFDILVRAYMTSFLTKDEVDYHHSLKQEYDAQKYAEYLLTRKRIYPLNEGDPRYNILPPEGWQELKRICQ